MYQFIIVFHVITSCIFVIIASYISTRSVAGWIKGWTYTKADNNLAIGLIGLLYLSLFLGIILYFFISDDAKVAGMDVQHAMKRVSAKFWAIEHFSVMTFALILSQIGRIFTNNSVNNKIRHGYAAFYYGMATFFTIFSLVFYLINR
jgi:hypothetical protein